MTFANQAQPRTAPVKNPAFGFTVLTLKRDPRSGSRRPPRGVVVVTEEITT